MRESFWGMEMAVEGLRLASNSYLFELADWY